MEFITMTLHVPIAIKVNDEINFEWLLWCDEHMNEIKNALRKKIKESWGFTDDEIDLMSFDFTKPFEGYHSDIGNYTDKEIYEKCHREWSMKEERHYGNV